MSLLKQCLNTEPRVHRNWTGASNPGLALCDRNEREREPVADEYPSPRGLGVAGRGEREEDWMAEVGPKSAGGILTINLSTIRANYALLQQRLAGAACGAVVKADAYGLGA